VRVDASMKRLMTSCPRSAGTFFTGRSLTSLNPSAVSRISVISSGVRGSIPRRSFERRMEPAVRIVRVAKSQSLKVSKENRPALSFETLRLRDFCDFISP
jgi:hypothetical protein